MRIYLAFHLKKLQSPSPKDALCQDCLNRLRGSGEEDFLFLCPRDRRSGGGGAYCFCPVCHSVILSFCHSVILSSSLKL